MKLSHILAGVLLAAVGGQSMAATVTGAGATFPQPVYSKWASEYQRATGNQVNYQGIGSSGGIKQIQANTVDFGASDAPLSKEELDKNGLIVIHQGCELDFESRWLLYGPNLSQHIFNSKI